MSTTAEDFVASPKPAYNRVIRWLVPDVPVCFGIHCGRAGTWRLAFEFAPTARRNSGRLMMNGCVCRVCREVRRLEDFRWDELQPFLAEKFAADGMYDPPTSPAELKLAFHPVAGLPDGLCE